MDFQGDPFRTLGITSEASLNEIRSAYRRLVKQYHPDTAGERALPRFLDIQAAYERLVDGEGRLRSAGGDPWRPGPPPRRASRDAWRARRSGPRPASGSRPRAARPDAGAGTGAGTATGTGAGAGGTKGTGPDGERPRRRNPRKATPGSTTYDEAAETPFEPEWDGGSWYGHSMGTYWTINPREYADPRKHGPEYLARARRAFGGGAGASANAGRADAGPATAPPEELGTAADASAEPDAGAWAWSGTGQTTTGGDTADWAARAWTYDTRDPGDATWAPGAESRRRPATSTAPPIDAPALPDLETLLRRASPASLLRYARRDRVTRFLIALLGWPAIAYAIGTPAFDATGCSSYSASCPDAILPVLLALDLVILAALYALPPLAAIAAFAALGALAVAIPVGFMLSVGSGPRAPETADLLRIAVVVAYLAAFAGAAWRLARRPRAPGPAA